MSEALDKLAQRLPEVAALLNAYGDVDVMKTQGPLTLAALAACAAEVERLEQKNRELNRRAQSAEKGLAEKLSANRGASMGRGLANAGYRLMEQRAEQAEVETLNKALRASEDKVDEVFKRAEQAEAELADAKNRLVVLDEALRLHVERLSEARCELAALKFVADSMEMFIDSCTYHVKNGETVVYEGPRRAAWEEE